jgi:hypothetical protein
MPAQPSTPAQPSVLEPGIERRLATRLFNRVWELLELSVRSRDEDDELLHATHASRFHWGVVGEPVDRARGEWQCSRVYAALGRAEPALHHARRCLDLADEHKLSPYDRGCAHEAIARAARLSGRPDEAAQHLALARAAAEEVADPEQRLVLLGDIDTA